MSGHNPRSTTSSESAPSRRANLGTSRAARSSSGTESDSGSGSDSGNPGRSGKSAAPLRQVEVHSQQELLAIDADLLRRAVCAVCNDERVGDAVISLAVVDDREIHRLNRQFLEHDYATDVLSFSLGESAELLEGEVIVSAETAVRRCAEFGWTASCELLWYVIHGVLHLCGYDDHSPEERAAMERVQWRYIRQFGCDQHGADRGVSGEQ